MYMVEMVNAVCSFEEAVLWLSVNVSLYLNHLKNKFNCKNLFIFYF